LVIGCNVQCHELFMAVARRLVNACLATDATDSFGLQQHSQAEHSEIALK
jgi:hypothetical protein